MPVDFKLTPKQREAMETISGDAIHTMLFGGSRSGKTFVHIRAIVIRALAASGSRHAVMRYRFKHVKSSVIFDTFPKVMKLCFPGVEYHLDKVDWYVRLENNSEIWFGGIDDKERSEKVLGNEYATIFLNEASQIPYSSVLVAVTRLAQVVTYEVDGVQVPLRLRMLYDCNPPSVRHWTYQLFMQRTDPETKKPVNPADYSSLLMNPADNIDNLPKAYLKMLEGLPPRLKARFLHGRFGEAVVGALWTEDIIERWREVGDLPDMSRVVVAVDPSGASDGEPTDKHDDVGIIVAGLGVDGVGYVLEDVTVAGGPSTWGKVATTAYDRHAADCVVGETNYGGGMVKYVIQTSRARTPYRQVTATRGKVVRAEPISVLAHDGRIRHAGNFAELESELCAFTDRGYIGDRSPNRADAYVWAFTELFHGIVKGKTKVQTASPTIKLPGSVPAGLKWMAG